VASKSRRFGRPLAGFLVVAHCTTACYGKYRTEIEYIMTSVSAFSLVPPPPMWAKLVGRRPAAS
jgi:hypothetical protein